MAIDSMPKGVACNGSFQLLGTPLGCMGAKGASLKFLSSVDDSIPRRGSRVLMSPFVAEAIGAVRRGLDALILGYNRTIRLGRMDIRFLPSGFGPGSVQLEVSLKDRKIVMIGALRNGQPLSAPCLEIPRCDLLLMDIEPAESRPPAPRRVATQMRKWIEGVLDEKRTPVLCADSRASALEAAWIVRSADMEVRACRPVFEMLKRVAPFGYSMPRLRRFNEKVDAREVLIHLAPLWSRRQVLPKGEYSVAYIGKGRTVPSFAQQGFRLGESEDRRGILSFVKETKAETVALGPRCDQATSELLREAGLEVYRVRKPSQIDLPFFSAT